MSKEYADLVQEIHKNNQKLISSYEKYVLNEIGNIQNMIKKIDRKINNIITKLQEFEVYDPENYEQSDQEEWNPYDLDYSDQDDEEI